MFICILNAIFLILALTFFQSKVCGCTQQKKLSLHWTLRKFVHIRFYLSYYKIVISCVWLFCLHIHMCTTCSFESAEDKRSCRWLWAVWVPRHEPGFSETAASSLTAKLPLQLWSWTLTLSWQCSWYWGQKHFHKLEVWRRLLSVTNGSKLFHLSSWKQARQKPAELKAVQTLHGET